MQQILSASGSDSFGETSWENGNPSGTNGSTEVEKNIIYQANSVSLPLIFKQYNIDCSFYNRKIICPFPNHNEKSASFYYYPDHNTYHCFGCKVGNRPCDFVSEIEGISKHEAARKIIHLFNDDIDFENVEIENQHDKLKIMMEFSDFVRDVISFSDAETLLKIEKICKVYDKLNTKHNLNYAAHKSIIDKLILQIKKI